jgi:hypothetical protein
LLWGQISALRHHQIRSCASLRSRRRLGRSRFVKLSVPGWSDRSDANSQARFRFLREARISAKGAKRKC